MLRPIPYKSPRGNIQTERFDDRLVIVDPARSGFRETTRAMVLGFLSFAIFVASIEFGVAEFGGFGGLIGVISSVFFFIFTTVSIFDALRARTSTSIMVVEGKTYEYTRRSLREERRYSGLVSDLVGFVRWDGPVKRLFVETADGILPFYRLDARVSDLEIARLNAELHRFTGPQDVCELDEIYRDDEIEVLRGPDVLRCGLVAVERNCFELLVREDGLVLKDSDIIRVRVPWQMHPRLRVRLGNVFLTGEHYWPIWLRTDQEEVINLVNRFIMQHENPAVREDPSDARKVARYGRIEDRMYAKEMESRQV